jgi:hypothetical protein
LKGLVLFVWKESVVRVFRDKVGAEWDVMVGRESWGMVVAIFVLREGPEPPRQALMDVTAADEGNRVLLGMTEKELQAMLDRSVPKPTE